jgi:hypothetical protein
VTVARRYVTHFDSHYAARGVAMIESLLRHDREAAVTVLCHDQRIETILGELAGRVTTLRPADLHAFEPRLAAAVRDRTPWERMATLKPALIAWTLARAEPGAAIAFIDADTWFFSDPAPVFAEVAAASIALSPHRLNPRTAHLGESGTFNAGFGIWRNDELGRRCVADWSEDCLRWCYNSKAGGGRFMNQGYLDAWPGRYPGSVAVIAHPGANLALWNVDSQPLARAGRALVVGGRPLIFFHYSSMSTSRAGDWYSLHPLPRALAPLLHDTVFAPYFAEVAAISGRLVRRHGISGTETARTYVWGQVHWLTGWRARLPLYRQVQRLAGAARRRFERGRRDQSPSRNRAS